MRVILIVPIIDRTLVLPSNGIHNVVLLIIDMLISRPKVSRGRFSGTLGYRFLAGPKMLYPVD